MNDFDAELLNELKDAGFPIQQDCGHCGEGWGFDIAPTLEELIKACKSEDGRLTLSQRDSKSSNNLWIAEKTYGVKRESELVGASTPIEAVARLWLVLQKRHEQPQTDKENG